MKIYTHPETVHAVPNVTQHFEMTHKYFSDLFFPRVKTEILNEDSGCEVRVIGVQHTDDSVINEGEHVVFISVENTHHSTGRTWYEFINKYGHTGHPSVKTYIHNTCDHPIYTDSYTVLPTVYFRMCHFRAHPEYAIQPKPLESKKMALFISRNGMNSVKKNLYATFQSAFPDQCDLLMHDPTVQGKTCYAGPEIIECMSKYKFIVVVENSVLSGYVTEKIFNAFYAGSIPIYDGTTEPERYFGNNCFLYARDPQLVRKMQTIVEDPELYEEIRDAPKLNEDTIKHAQNAVALFTSTLPH